MNTIELSFVETRWTATGNCGGEMNRKWLRGRKWLQKLSNYAVL